MKIQITDMALDTDNAGELAEKLFDTYSSDTVSQILNKLAKLNTLLKSHPKKTRKSLDAAMKEWDRTYGLWSQKTTIADLIAEKGDIGKVANAVLTERQRVLGLYFDNPTADIVEVRSRGKLVGTIKTGWSVSIVRFFVDTIIKDLLD